MIYRDMRNYKGWISFKLLFLKELKYRSDKIVTRHKYRVKIKGKK